MRSYWLSEFINWGLWVWGFCGVSQPGRLGDLRDWGVLVLRGQDEVWGQKLLLCVLSPPWQWVKVKGGDRWADNQPKGRGPGVGEGSGYD